MGSMTDPVLVAVPPKGGSFDDVLKRLVRRGWLSSELVAAMRRLIKDDKRRVKLEEGLIALWRENGHEREATLRAADRAGHDLGEVETALGGMRRWNGPDGRIHLDYSPKVQVDALLGAWRNDPDPVVKEAAGALHIQLDLGRPGRPSRIVFNHLEAEVAPAPGQAPVRAMILGTDHEVTPTYLRKHKRDLSLTCYDAFHNTMLDALDTPKVRNWKELTGHLIQANTDVRILGSLGLDDYLGHCVLMSDRMAARVKVLGATRCWAEGTDDPKLALLKGAPVLIDPQYEEVYALLLDAARHGIAFTSGPKDIERICAEENRVAIYIVRSGSTVAMTPGLCVVGEELITSETIVAVNGERMRQNRDIARLADSLEPSQADHSSAWRSRLAEKLGDRLI